MPVTDNSPSEEETGAHPWGFGSIRQKIQMWESIEDITKKTPVVKKRPALHYDTTADNAQASPKQTTPKQDKKQPEQKTRKPTTENDPKQVKQKPTKQKHNDDKHKQTYTSLDKEENARTKTRRSSKDASKHPRDHDIIKAQKKPKPSDVGQDPPTQPHTHPATKQAGNQPETSPPRVVKRRSSKDRPLELRDVPVQPVPLTRKTAAQDGQAKTPDRPTQSGQTRAKQENGDVTIQHGDRPSEDSTDLHAPELVALLMGQPHSQASQLHVYSEKTHGKQDVSDDEDDDYENDDDDDQYDANDVRDHAAEVKKSAAGGPQGGKKRSEVFLTLTNNDTLVLDHIPEVTVTHSEEDQVRDVLQESVKNNSQRPEMNLGLYPIDEYDSESTTATIIVEDLPSFRDYTKVKGISAMKAEAYEVKLAALLYLRGINHKMEFKLAANVEGAGNFGDLVFKYKTQHEDKGNVWKTCFIQLKYKETNILTSDALAAKEGSLSLVEDYKSYSLIASKMSTESTDSVFSGSLKDSSFVLYTNAIVSERLGLRLGSTPTEGIDKLIKSGSNDELIFSLDEDRDQNIYSVLGQDKGRFLKSLKIFSGQPSEIDLDHMVKMELRSACSKYLSNVHIIYRFFIEAVQQWWLDDNHFLTQNINILDKAENILNVYNLTASQRMLFKLQDVNFQSENLEQWKDEIRKGNSLLCIVTTGMTSKFSCTKLMQILWEENTEYIFTGLRPLLNQDKEVLREWMSGEKDMLVIVSESFEDQDDLCEGLCRVIRKKPHKQLVIISQPCDPFTMNVQLKYGSTYEELYDPFDLLQLDKDSTDTLLEKEVKFQGCPIYLRCIIGENLERISKILTSENFDMILENNMISIGEEMTGHIEEYITRSFERCDVFKSSILTADDFWGVIAVSNTTLDELQMLVSSGKKVGLASDPETKDYRYLVLDSLDPEEQYVTLCESRKDVHWLHMLDDNTLLWKRSQRNISTLSHYKEDVSSAYQPDHVLDLDDRVILVVADPKMGKSTLTTRLALETKLADPSMWVIKAHLNECTAYLDKTFADEFDAVDFLSTVGLDKNKMDFLDRDLLKFSVEELGNVAVFLDGFDAIVPRYLRKVLALLTSLIQTKIRKIFITSQHGMKDMLETHLATFAYKMCPDDRVREAYV